MQRVSPWLNDTADDAAPPNALVLPSDWQRDRLLHVLRRALPARRDAVLEPAWPSCEAYGKAFCRACHPGACPKCGGAGQS